MGEETSLLRVEDLGRQATGSCLSSWPCDGGHLCSFTEVLSFPPHLFSLPFINTNHLEKSLFGQWWSSFWRKKYSHKDALYSSWTIGSSREFSRLVSIATIFPKSGSSSQLDYIPQLPLQFDVAMWLSFSRWNVYAVSWPKLLASGCVPIPSPNAFCPLPPFDADLEALRNSGDSHGKSLDHWITCGGELPTDRNHLPKTLPKGEITFFCVCFTVHFGFYSWLTDEIQLDFCLPSSLISVNGW